MTTITIINSELFNSLVNDVDTSGIRYNEAIKGFNGDLTIDLVEGGFKKITGNHGCKDYVNDFGFQIEYTPSWVIKDNGNGKALDWNGQWTGIETNARFFASDVEAKNYIVECNWSDWAYVEEIK